jgi:hypothetical protein
MNVLLTRSFNCQSSHVFLPEFYMRAEAMVKAWRDINPWTSALSIIVTSAAICSKMKFSIIFFQKNPWVIHNPFSLITILHVIMCYICFLMFYIFWAHIYWHYVIHTNSSFHHMVLASSEQYCSSCDDLLFLICSSCSTRVLFYMQPWGSPASMSTSWIKCPLYHRTLFLSISSLTFHNRWMVYALSIGAVGN